MEKMETFAKVQRDVMNTSEDLRSTVKDLLDWEKDIKHKEQQLLKGGQNEEKTLPPIRSHIKSEQPNETQKKTLETTKVDANKSTETKTTMEKATVSKEKGNKFVQLGKYEEAIYFYTDAINHFDSDPVYFSNRALCYLKLKKFDQCIEDCNKAIKINKSAIKAYYRRMLANEGLGKFPTAIKDCETLLQIDPKNVEAKKSLINLNQKLKKTGYQMTPVPLKPEFSKINKNMKEISAFSKPAHLRSKKPLKRVDVIETISLTRTNKNTWDSNDNISDEILDKLFNNNDVGNYIEVKRSPSTEEQSLRDLSNNELNSVDATKDESSEKELHSEKIELITEIKPDIQVVEKEIVETSDKPEDKMVKSISKEFNEPISSSQFYVTWNELNQADKFLFLKSIKMSNLVKFLGPGLEPDMITDIFSILKNFYMKQNLEIIEILLEISKHERFNILSMFLSEQDRELLADFINYMNKRKNNPEVIQTIEVGYYFKPFYD